MENCCDATASQTFAPPLIPLESGVFTGEHYGMHSQMDG